MLNYYTQTKILLNDLGYTFDSWAEVPKDEKAVVYEMFTREIPPADFAEFICDRYAAEDYAILLSSQNYTDDYMLFAQKRSRAFLFSCNDVIDNLFEESKPRQEEIILFNREQMQFREMEAA